MAEFKGDRESRRQTVPNTHCPDAGIQLIYGDGKLPSAHLVVNGSLNRYSGIRIATSSGDGPFSPAKLVSGKRWTSDFARAIPVGGKVLVAWSRFDQGGHADGAEFVLIRPNGKTTAKRLVPGSRKKAFNSLAAGPRGKAVIALHDPKARRVMVSSMSRFKWNKRPRAVTQKLPRKAVHDPALIYGSWKPTLIWTRPTLDGGGRGIYYASRRYSRP